jgi:ribosomal protein S18 acetylase RimI-like enzyme
MAMNSHIVIRRACASDTDALKPIVDATLFPADMLDDMMAPFLNDPQSQDLWHVADINGDIVGVTFCEPERLTQGCWNMLAIAVAPQRQGEGIGAALTRHLETVLQSQNGRILIAETSALPEYDQTRAFYRKLGYHEEARIRDFYDAGEDKIVFWKSLAV